MHTQRRKMTQSISYKINEHKRTAARPKCRSRNTETTCPTVQENAKITDFFPVRRSNRRTARELKVAEQERIENAIHNANEEGIDRFMTSTMGRGIKTTRAFTKGEFIVEYRGDLINSSTAAERNKSYMKDPKAGFFMFYFRHNSQNYCIDATIETSFMGRLVNHSHVNPNVKSRIHVDNGGKPHIVLVALQPIGEGEEIKYDYADTNKQSIKDNPWLKKS